MIILIIPFFVELVINRYVKSIANMDGISKIGKLAFSISKEQDEFFWKHYPWNVGKDPRINLRSQVSEKTGTAGPGKNGSPRHLEYGAASQPLIRCAPLIA